jgi:hypothetical protein
MERLIAVCAKVIMESAFFPQNSECNMLAFERNNIERNNIEEYRDTHVPADWLV